MTIVVTKPEVASSTIRTAINEVLFSMQLDAQRNEELERLLIERDIAVKEAYRFSYGVVVMDKMEVPIISDTYFVACEVIALKERYAKRIRRCKLRHKRFKDILTQLPLSDSETLAKALCTSIEVDERDVKKVIRKHLKFMQSFYPED